MKPEPAAGTVASVDHDLCAGVAQCLRAAPGAFHLDEDGLSVFDPHGPWTMGEVLEAADSCPMAAIEVAAPEAGTGAQPTAG
jgi:ferredoxin